MCTALTFAFGTVFLLFMLYYYPLLTGIVVFLYIAVPEVHTVNHVHDNCFFASHSLCLFAGYCVRVRDDTE